MEPVKNQQKFVGMISSSVLKEEETEQSVADQKEKERIEHNAYMKKWRDAKEINDRTAVQLAEEKKQEKLKKEDEE